MNTRLAKIKIQEWLIKKISDQLNIDSSSIDVNDSFNKYGMSSTDIVLLSGELEDFLGRRLSPTLAYEYPSILSLSNYLASSEELHKENLENSVHVNPKNEPIAIIGISCRFPGANDPESFWKLLEEGRDMISEVPEDRWSKKAFFHPDPSIPGKAVSYWGGFLDQIDQFDPHFFGISPKEAKQMDPQQRLLMELSYEALDDAGQKVLEINGSRTGVFIGISVNEYSQLQLKDPLHITSHSGTGSALSIAANRISFYYNFRGPSISIDTACSSSLSAVHLACQSLRSGECNMALAGGVNIILSPAHSIAFTKAGVLSPDGKCKTFDASANGYVRGEGGGAIILKTLSKAEKDGDPIHAVIQGSAMIQDGRTNGLMAPSQESQELLLREAYHIAGVSPNTVQYVEAHGTGTLLGDSMEANAIGSVIGRDRSEGSVSIGSVKTNFGHLEAAAGMAGLIKTVLSLRHGLLPPSLNFDTPNPHVSFDELNLSVQKKLESWPSKSALATAGVSSFGFGGTNVHMVIQKAISNNKALINAEDSINKSNKDFFLALSGINSENLNEDSKRLSQLLSTNLEYSTYDICYASCTNRSQLDYRMAVVGSSREDIIQCLRVYNEGNLSIDLFEGVVTNHNSKIAFVFSGQGGQWQGMGRELLQTESVFYQSIQHIDKIIQSKHEWSLMDVLTYADSNFHEEDISVVQPAIFAIQVALFNLLTSKGITPDAAIGHSMGEVAAAHVSGILNLDDAIDIICLRSKCLQALSGKGSMLATELTLEQAEEILKGYESRVSIAAINGPTSIVLSGDPAKINEIATYLENKNLFCRKVNVEVAAHSPQMDLVKSQFIELLDGIEPRKARIPIYSTVTGKFAEKIDFNVEYWVDNLRKPVLFESAFENLMDDGHKIFLEFSPHPILLNPMNQSSKTKNQAVHLVPTMKRDEPERKNLLRCLGKMYALGSSINWDQLFPKKGTYVPLPPILWDRKRYWLDESYSAPLKNWQQIQDSDLKTHPLLGKSINLANSPLSYVWQTVLDLRKLSYLSDHMINDEIVLPATAYIEMALAAAKQSGLNQSMVLTEFIFEERIILSKDKPNYIQAILSPINEGEFIFQIYFRNSEHQNWVSHASVNVIKRNIKKDSSYEDSLTVEQVIKNNSYTHSGKDLYNYLKESDIQYGPAFQGVHKIWRHEGELVGQIKIAEGLKYESEDYYIHPAVLDACLQILIVSQIPSNDTAQYIPIGCREVRYYSRPNGIIYCRASKASARNSNSEIFSSDFKLFDENHQILAEILGVQFKRIAYKKSVKILKEDAWLYHTKWKTMTLAEKPISHSSDKKNWLILEDEEGVGEELVKKLKSKGDHCERIQIKQFEHDKEDIFPQTLNELLKDISVPIYGIIHLWSLSIPPKTEDNSWKEAWLGCNSVLNLVQFCAKSIIESPRLYLITRGAQSVIPGESVAFEQSALWGFGKVISFEFPEYKCTRIDLDPNHSGSKSATNIYNQIFEEFNEDQISFRSNEIYVPRLLPFTEDNRINNSEFEISAKGSYLITGGMGGLGMVSAKWLVSKGARHIILIGRTKPSDLVRTAIKQMEEQGVEVIIKIVDVSDFQKIKSVFEELQKEMPPVRGIIHAAGVLDDGSIINLNESRMAKVMKPKAQGSWNLHIATKNLDLDFFVLYSSAVSVLGSPGQSNYAAASSYIDALAHHRTSLGLPALSINWGPWAEVGLAAAATQRLEDQNASTQHLVKVISIESGLHILEYLLTKSNPQLAVLPFDLKNLLELYPTAAHMAFFSEIRDGDSHLTRLYARPKLRQEYVAPRNNIERKLAELWKQTLHIDKVGINDSFFELGGDSVLAAQVLALARKSYGININPQDAFEAFTIKSLAELLETRIIEQIDNMSEEEAQRLLSEKD